MTECKDEHILNSIDYPEDLRKLSPDKFGRGMCRVASIYNRCTIGESGTSWGKSRYGRADGCTTLCFLILPIDRIVWDVGHQAYGHKILTGRREAFHTLRKI